MIKLKNCNKDYFFNLINELEKDEKFIYNIEFEERRTNGKVDNINFRAFRIIDEKY